MSTTTAPPQSADGRTPSLDSRRYRDLFGARSVVGGILVLTLLCVFGFGVQMLDDAVRNSEGFSVGEPVAVTGAVSFSPVDGWVNDPDQSVVGLGVVAVKNGWNVKVAGPFSLPAGQSLADFATIFHDLPPDDPGDVTSDLQTFTTASGQSGVWWEVHGTARSRATYLVANASGSVVAQLLADGPGSSLAAVEKEINDMATSIVVKDDAAKVEQ